MTIRVVLADDHQMMREGLALALNTYTDIAIVGEAVNGEQALAQVELLRPDVLLLDIFMPVLDGIAVARRMRARFPEVRVVVLTMDSDADDLRQLADARVMGLVMKDSRSSAVVQAIRAAMRGEALPHPLARSDAAPGEPMHGDAVSVGVRFDLSERERQILCQLTRGKSNKEIARTCAIAERTVRNHLYHIYDKMAVDDRTQAVILALRYGLCVDAEDHAVSGDDASPGHTERGARSR